MWKIFDWAGNDLTGFYGTFESFEDAWDILFDRFESEDDLGEFQVLEA